MGAEPKEDEMQGVVIDFHRKASKAQIGALVAHLTKLGHSVAYAKNGHCCGDGLQVVCHTLYGFDRPDNEAGKVMKESIQFLGW